MARKARQEGAKAAPEAVSVHPAPTGLAAIVEAFKEAHSEEWEALRLCPLQHGLAEMVRLLK